MPVSLRSAFDGMQMLGGYHWMRYAYRRVIERLGASYGREYYLGARNLEHPLVLRSRSSDIAVFRQVFAHEHYGCVESVRDGGWIIDCGANCGISTVYFLNRFKGAHVVAVEPDPENYQQLVRQIRRYGSRCIALHAGVWGAVGRLRPAARRFGDGREWSRSYVRCENGDVNRVRATTIDEILREHAIRDVALLKIDIEGAERSVFRDKSAKWIERIEKMVIEFHGEECERECMEAVLGRMQLVKRFDDLTVFERCR